MMFSLRSLIFTTALAVVPAMAQVTPASLQGGFVEGADVMMFMNAQQLNKSGFSQAMKKLQAPEKAALQKEMQEKFTAATGLGEEDMVSVVMSMDMDGINLEEPDPAQMAKVPAVLAVQLTKAVTLAQVQAGVKVMLQEQIGELSVEPATVDGLNLLVLKPAAPAEESKGPQQAYCSVSADGKTVLMALNTASLRDALGRIAAGKVAAPGADMANAMRTMGNKPLRLALVFPPKIREKIAQGIQEGAAAGGMGAMFMPFSTVSSLLVSADVKDTFDLSLQLDLGNPNNAQQASGMMLGMLPMAAQMGGPKAMEMSQKLKIAAEGSVVGVTIALTPDDLKQEALVAPEMMMPMEME